MRPRRRGYALALVMGAALLLLTFLIAAQGSVLSGHRRAKASQSRIERAALTQDLLTLARAALMKDPAAGQAEPLRIERGGRIRGVIRIEKLAPPDAVYEQGHGLAYREGDHRATVEVTGLGVERPACFLINATGARMGAIPIPLPESSGNTTQEPVKP